MPVVAVAPLGFPWKTPDPFLFCAYHDDAYPAGNDKLGPIGTLAGREIGSDFAGKDGWRMYHGRTVPGFPQHPHRGFETVTIVRNGFIDHSDSLGATARFGRGDVQWLTAGRGINHCEMFPLVDASGPNPVELFQIWLNLPRAGKMVDPYFTMLWADRIPRHVEPGVEVTVVAGKLGDATPLAPPPDSWAARDSGDVAIWTIKLDAGATWTPPPQRDGSTRAFYVFRGMARIDDRQVTKSVAVVEGKVSIHAVSAVEILMLQGKPIGEPVVQYGPFVMNSRAEIEQAFADYQRTQFGGWPWPVDDPVHARGEGRFAKRPDGVIEKP